MVAGEIDEDVADWLIHITWLLLYFQYGPMKKIRDFHGLDLIQFYQKW